jgi:hypothetical protein
LADIHLFSLEIEEEQGSSNHQLMVPSTTEFVLEFAIIVHIKPPILDQCLDNWVVRTHIDGRLIENVVDATEDRVHREILIYQMPLKIGRKRMMAFL